MVLGLGLIISTGVGPVPSINIHRLLDSSVTSSPCPEIQSTLHVRAFFPELSEAVTSAVHAPSTAIVGYVMPSKLTETGQSKSGLVLVSWKSTSPETSKLLPGAILAPSSTAVPCSITS